MTFTDREAEVLKDAIAILNKHLDGPIEKKLQSIADFKNEGVYEFTEKSELGFRHIQGYCEAQGMSTKLDSSPMNMSMYPVLKVRHTMNSELLALQDMDKEIL